MRVEMTGYGHYYCRGIVGLGVGQKVGQTHVKSETFLPQI
jgi:hypothetical protein